MSNKNTIIELLSKEENDMLIKGKEHWNMESLNKNKNVKSHLVKEIIDKVIENTWMEAKKFYENDNKDNK